MQFYDPDAEKGYENPDDVAARHVETYGTADEYAAAMREELQRRFIPKVYAIIGAQLAFTFGYTLICMYAAPAVGQWTLDNFGWLQWVCFFAQIISLVVLFCYKVASSQPKTYLRNRTLIPVQSHSLCNRGTDLSKILFAGLFPGQHASPELVYGLDKHHHGSCRHAISYRRTG